VFVCCKDNYNVILKQSKKLNYFRLEICYFQYILTIVKLNDMKTFFLSAFLIVATMFTASAQLLPSFQFGIKGGANFSDIKDISLKSSSRTGYLVGAWARLGGAGV